MVIRFTGERCTDGMRLGPEGPIGDQPAQTAPRIGGSALLCDAELARILRSDQSEQEVVSPPEHGLPNPGGLGEVSVRHTLGVDGVPLRTVVTVGPSGPHPVV